MTKLQELLSDLRTVAGLGEARSAFDAVGAERALDNAIDFIDKNWKEAVAKDAVDLAGSWTEIFDYLVSQDKDVLVKDGKPSSETQWVRKKLREKGYAFDKPPGSDKEFVYAPGNSPYHLKLDRLTTAQKDARKALRSATTDQEKKDLKAAMDQLAADKEDVEAHIKRLEKRSAPEDVSEPVATFVPSKELKALQKDAKAAEKRADAALNAKDREAALKDLARIQTAIAKETADLEQAQGVSASGEPTKGDRKKPASPKKPDDEKDQRLKSQDKIIGAYQGTAQAKDAVDQFKAGMEKVLDGLEGDAAQGKFDNDRRIRLQNLIRTLEQTVLAGDSALRKVGVVRGEPEKDKKVAEGVENA
jgi:hypothetical protein